MVGECNSKYLLNKMKEKKNYITHWDWELTESITIYTNLITIPQCKYLIFKKQKKFLLHSKVTRYYLLDIHLIKCTTVSHYYFRSTPTISDIIDRHKNTKL